MPAVQGFREAFPYFTEERFSDARLSFWLKFAMKQLPEKRWEELWDEGCYLFMAHYLSLEALAGKSAAGTGGVEAAAGAVVSSSKSVGGVSKSESRAGAAATGDQAAGQWNDSIYGRQLWQLICIIGAGGTVV